MRVIGALLALALTATACSSERQASGNDDVTGTRASAPSASVATTAPPAGTVPAGAQRVRVDTLHISFAAPELYTALEPTELGSDFYDSNAFIDLAGRIELEPDVFAESLREGLSIFLFAPADPQGYVDNITVSATDESELPSEEDVLAQLSSVSATDVSVESATVSGADVLRVGYTRAGDSGALAARDLYVVTDAGLVSIGVVPAEPGEADRVADLIAGTLVIAGE